MRLRATWLPRGAPGKALMDSALAPVAGVAGQCESSEIRIGVGR